MCLPKQVFFRLSLIVPAIDIPVQCKGAGLDDLKGPFQTKWIYDSTGYK